MPEDRAALPEWVADLSDRYGNFMINPLPAGDGICERCRTPFAGGQHTACYRCGRQLNWLAAVVPITYSINLGPMHVELRSYKDGWGADRTDELRDRHTVGLAAVLSRFLATHEPCVARAAGGRMNRATLKTLEEERAEREDAREVRRQQREEAAADRLIDRQRDLEDEKHTRAVETESRRAAAALRLLGGELDRLRRILETEAERGGDQIFPSLLVPPLRIRDEDRHSIATWAPDEIWSAISFAIARVESQDVTREVARTSSNVNVQKQFAENAGEVAGVIESTMVKMAAAAADL